METKANKKRRIKPGSKTQREIASHFNCDESFISNCLKENSQYKDTPKGKEIRMYAIKECNGKYITAVKPVTERDLAIRTLKNTFSNATLSDISTLEDCPEENISKELEAALKRCFRREESKARNI